MKRFLCTLLLLVFFAGCGVSDTPGKNTVSFYYPRQSFHYTSPDGSMGRELRELTDRADDLNYLIHLYLLGPQNENLIAIFPRTTQLFSAELAENTLTIHLSSGSSTLSDIQFTLAAAGLARSCLEFSAAQTVVIHCGDREITLDSTNMLFTDESAAPETEE